VCLPTGRAIRSYNFGWMLEMRRIIQANIDRFRLLQKTETDSTKQAMQARLLAEEETKLSQARANDKNEPEAF
jgi:hypothetical protein